MKRNIVLLLMFVIIYGTFLTVRAESFGTVTGCLTTADAPGFGVGYIGGYVSYGDDASTIFGNISYGFSDYTEGRIMVGFSDPDFRNADPGVLLGADIKYEVMDYNDKLRKNPLDAAFGAFFEFINYDGFSTLGTGAYVIGSIPYRFSSGHKITPYSRLNLRWERISFDVNNDILHDSRFRLGFNFGVKMELIKDTHVYGEFQLDGNTGILAGIDFRAF